MAPTCLPRPIIIILHNPLSMGPWKPVCGLMRATTPTWSASEAYLSRTTGMPASLSPRETTSMDALIGTPTAASVMP